jgi:hypothetical protein
MPRKGIKKEYVTVSIPIELAKQIDELVASGKGNFLQESRIRSS